MILISLSPSWSFIWSSSALPFTDSLPFAFYLRAPVTADTLNTISWSVRNNCTPGYARHSTTLPMLVLLIVLSRAYLTLLFSYWLSAFGPFLLFHRTFIPLLRYVRSYCVHFCNSSEVYTVLSTASMFAFYTRSPLFRGLRGFTNICFGTYIRLHLLSVFITSPCSPLTGVFTTLMRLLPLFLLELPNPPHSLKW